MISQLLGFDSDYIIRYMRYFEKINFIPGGDTNG